MKQYLDLLRHVKEHGTMKGDRTGTGTKSVFGYQMRFNLADGLSAADHKETPSEINHLRAAVVSARRHQRALSARTRRAHLERMGDPDGNLGHIYGYQWRSWPDYDGGFIDQISEAIETIKHNPDSRRIIVSAWNVADLKHMNLPPCHAFFQFYVADGKLSLQLYQRSADIFLGVPFNIASYALLLMMVAQVTGLEAGEFVHTLGDAHIYTNHFEQVEEQLKRDPRKLPTMRINPDVKSIFDFKYEDFTLEDYNPHPHIKGIVAV